MRLSKITMPMQIHWYFSLGPQFVPNKHYPEKHVIIDTELSEGQISYDSQNDL